jgi:hypothetical protein
VPGRSAWARALAACWGIHLLLVSITRLAAAMISCLLTSSTSPSQQRSVRCEGACEELGLQVGASMMSCKYSSNPAKFKFRDFIREIKQRADLAGDGQRTPAAAAPAPTNDTLFAGARAAGDEGLRQASVPLRHWGWDQAGIRRQCRW